MDPNTGKKGMFNKLSKQQAMKLLNKETFKRKTISFYRYVIIDSPKELRDILYSEWNSLGVLGRINLANEGINAQLSVPENNFTAFKTSINANIYFRNMRFKIAVEDKGDSFFKLSIKVRRKIVADGLQTHEYDVTNVGMHLTAEQWNKAIENGATVVDVRNHYETEIGKFKGAICTDVETFKQELPAVKDMLKGMEDDPILLYCTGGIRCEKTSAYLKHHGFQDVNQLHGGIIDYARQLKEDKSLINHYVGKNFVFDERRGERISDDIISSCHQCGSPYDSHVNCSNVNCNLLFLQCEKCKVKFQECCSVDCIEIMKLPEDQQKEIRRKSAKKKLYYSHKRVKLNLKRND
jgi:UPF0176 protein